MSDRPQRRIRFVECRIQDQGDRIETSVALVDGDTPFEGTVKRPHGEDRPAWDAAEAAVAALCQAYGLESDALRLKDVVSFEIDGHPAVATSITSTVGDERRSLFGLSRVVDDDGQAAALAVLGATNRVFRNG